MPPFTISRNQIDWRSGTFDFASPSIKFRPDATVTADYVCTVHPDSLELLLVSSPPSTTTGKIYNHSGKLGWNGEGVAYDSEVVHNNAVGEINALTSKELAAANDVLLLEDSTASYAKKKVRVGDLPTTDSTAVHDDVNGEINAVANKATPVGADVLLIEDSNASYAKKKALVSSLPGGSGTDADAIHDNVAAEISAVTLKATPESGDFLLIEDSGASNAKKRVTIGTLPGGGESSVVFEETVTVAKQTINITGLTGKTSARIYLKHVVPSGVTDVASLYIDDDFTTARYARKSAYPTGSGFGSAAGTSPLVSNCVSDKENMVTIEVNVINGAFYIFATEGRHTTGDTAFIFRHVYYDYATVTDLGTLQLKAGTATGFGPGTVVTVVDPFGGGGGGGGTDSNAIHDNVAAEISVVTEKTTPISADFVLIEDSADSNNKKRVQIGNLPGDGDAIHDDVNGEINAITLEKTTLVDGDLVLIEDSAASYAKKKVQVSNLPGGGGGGITWQSLSVAGPTTATSGNGYAIDAASNSVTLNLPASPSVGDTVAVQVRDAANTITLGRNTKVIEGVASDLLLTKNEAYTFVYADVATGWVRTAAAQGRFYSSVNGTTATFDTFVDTLDGAVQYQYFISTGANMRSGIVRAHWDASADSCQFDDIAVASIGDTSDFSFTVDISSNMVRLRGTATGNYTTVRFVKTTI